MEGLGEIEKFVTKGRGGLQSGGNFLQDGGAGGTLIWLMFLVPLDSNGDNGGRHTQQVSETNRGEAVVAEG